MPEGKFVMTDKTTPQEEDVHTRNGRVIKALAAAEECGDME